MGLATVVAASSSIRIQMTYGLLTKISINILIGVGQLQFVYFFLISNWWTGVHKGRGSLFDR